MTSMVPWSRSMFPMLADLLSEPWPFGEHTPIRIEERTEDGKWILRAELPGIDPDKNIRISTQSGILTIAAERESTEKQEGRSEFRYGSFRRSVRLPAGTDPETITASYTNGILEITVPVETSKSGGPVTIDVKTD